MEKLIKGDVIVFPYPFTDFSSNKRRPALVVATPEGNDLIVCQITSQVHFDKYSIKLSNFDFENGKLNLLSYIRPNKLISIDKNIILYKIGNLTQEKTLFIINEIVELIQN